MSRSRRRIGAILIAAAVVAAAIALMGDITSAANDPLALAPGEGVGRPPTLGPGPDINASPSSAAEPVLRGNPLWGITVESLSATRDRPLFSPSRRPPAAVAPTTSFNVTAPSEPEKPPLDLIGIVTGSGEGYAVFVNTTTHAVIRLRTGEGHDGWVLLTAKGHEAVLQRHDRTVVVSFPKPSQNNQ